MVNKERVQRLVDALRSGEYSQTTGGLRNEDGYCCLGVACDLFSQENPLSGWVQSSSSGATYGIHYDFQAFPEEAGLLDPQREFDLSNSTLPWIVAEWYDFIENTPILLETEFGGSHRADTLNDEGMDGEGLSFEEIADLFEARFLKEDSEEGN